MEISFIMSISYRRREIYALFLELFLHLFFLNFFQLKIILTPKKHILGWRILVPFNIFKCILFIYKYTYTYKYYDPEHASVLSTVKHILSEHKENKSLNSSYPLQTSFFLVEILRILRIAFIKAEIALDQVEQAKILLKSVAGGKW